MALKAVGLDVGIGAVLGPLPDPALAFDGGRSTRPVVWANQALAAALGRDPTGEPLGAALGGATGDVIDAASGLRVGQCRTVSVELPDGNGNARVVRVDEDLVVVIAVDSQADAELRRSNLDLEQFAFVASHDLVEPLRMVTAYLDLISELYADRFDDKGRQYLDFAVDGAVRMRALVHDLLAFARLNGAGAAPHRIVDLDAVVAEARKGLEVTMADAQATVEVDGPLPAVLGDRGQLVQLVANVLSNAVKFAPAASAPVRVRASRADDGRLVRVEVLDRGIGIAPAQRAQVFELFRRLHPRSRYGGTGLGLAICKAVVTRHGGEIGIDEADGGGTVVWFTLRAASDWNPT